MADWIAALSTLAAAVIAGIAAGVGLKTFRSQRTASDVQMALGIFNEINRYWDRLSEQPNNYEYNMGQILAQFEIASGLFNKNILTDDATLILGDHIVEVFSQISMSPDGIRLLETCQSSHSTFQELKKFIRDRMPQALNTADFHNQRLGREAQVSSAPQAPAEGARPAANSGGA